MMGEPTRFPGGMLALIVTAALLLAACAGDPPRSVESAQFTGVPLPRDYHLDADRSVTLGGGDRWVGRLIFTTGLSSEEAAEFFREEMPRYGWGEGAAAPSEHSILTFFSGPTGRVSVIQVVSRTLWGSRFEMVVSSPNDSGARSGPAPPTRGLTADPAIMPAPVTVQPLQ